MDSSSPARVSQCRQWCMKVMRCRPILWAHGMRLIVVRAIVAHVLCPRGVSDSKTLTLPCPDWVSNLGLSLVATLACKLKKCFHSVNFRTLGAMKRTPFGTSTFYIRSGTTSISIVGVKSSTLDSGSPAKKMMLPRWVISFVVCSCVDVNEYCVRLASM